MRARSRVLGGGAIANPLSGSERRIGPAGIESEDCQISDSFFGADGSTPTVLCDALSNDIRDNIRSEHVEALSQLAKEHVGLFQRRSDDKPKVSRVRSCASCRTPDSNAPAVSPASHGGRYRRGPKTQVGRRVSEHGMLSESIVNADPILTHLAPLSLIQY
jgi:hypothetical protein